MLKFVMVDKLIWITIEIEGEAAGKALPIDLNRISLQSWEFMKTQKLWEQLGLFIEKQK